MNKIKYSVVIPTYNHCDDLLRPCLESIEKYSDMSITEVIIVANGCIDNTKEYVLEKIKQGSNFRLISMPDPAGYPKATNEGIKYSTGEFVVLMNNDTVLLEQPRDNWLNMLAAPFVDPAVGVTGPVKFSWDCGGIERTAMAFWLVMIRRSLFSKIGLLDEIFSPGMGEDGDFCIKAEQAGYKLISVPVDVKGEFDVGIANFNFPIWHKGNGTFADKNTEKTEAIDKNNKILVERYGKQVEVSIIIPTSKNFNNALYPCLESLLRHTDLNNKEVIVVANGSPPEARTYLDSIRNKVRYIWFDEPTGVVKAYNVGINNARGKYIVLIDDDSILLGQPVDTWINILKQPFLTDEKVGATSPFANEYEDMGFVLHSGCTMYDADLLRQVGMFDEIYNPGYFSDSDVSMKIWNAGRRCVEVPSDRANKEYKDGVFKVEFPVIHMGTVQTMDKKKDTKIVAKNREILYSRYGKKKMDELESAYEWCLNHKSDSNEHFPVLREYASKCKHITEFGTRGVFSTYAFMAAKPKRLITYDIQVDSNIWTADRIAKEHGIEFAFMERDTRTCDVIEETDLLFIDTAHTYEQVKIELERHALRVRKYIIFHDTVSYGTVGEDGGEGILKAIDEFVEKSDWRKVVQYYFNNGLMILERKHD